MKNLLNIKSLIRVAVIMVVMAFMASQVTDTYARGWGKWKGTSGGGYNHNGESCDEIQNELDECKAELEECKNAGNHEIGECPTCCDAWDKKLGEDRFEVIWDGVAVLDKETCLVWEQSPDTAPKPWTSALLHCFTSEVGGRGGWRLPTIEELTSLKDTVNTEPALPSGHPFDTTAVQFDPNTIEASRYWSATGSPNSLGLGPENAYNMRFSSGNVGITAKGGSLFVWCVRGGQGYDGQ